MSFRSLLSGLLGFFLFRFLNLGNLLRLNSLLGLLFLNLHFLNFHLLRFLLLRDDLFDLGGRWGGRFLFHLGSGRCWLLRSMGCFLDGGLLLNLNLLGLD